MYCEFFSLQCLHKSVLNLYIDTVVSVLILLEYSDADGHSNSESESEEGQSEGALVEPTDSNDGVGTAMEVDEESLKTTALDSVGNYDWLIDHFCQNH